MCLGKRLALELTHCHHLPEHGIEVFHLPWHTAALWLVCGAHLAKPAPQILSPRCRPGRRAALAPEWCSLSPH